MVTWCPPRGLDRFGFRFGIRIVLALTSALLAVLFAARPSSVQAGECYGADPPCWCPGHGCGECEDCTAEGCVPACDSEDCEECVDGSCQSTCDTWKCEACSGGSCASWCLSTEICVDGACQIACHPEFGPIHVTPGSGCNCPTCSGLVHFTFDFTCSGACVGMFCLLEGGQTLIGYAFPCVAPDPCLACEVNVASPWPITVLEECGCSV